MVAAVGCGACALCLWFSLARAAAAAQDAWRVPPATLLGAFQCLARWESGSGTTSRNIYGLLDGWAVAGGSGYAADHSPAEQLYRAWRLYQWSLARYGDGWLPWPNSRRKCGL